MEVTRKVVKPTFAPVVITLGTLKEVRMLQEHLIPTPKTYKLRLRLHEIIAEAAR